MQRIYLLVFLISGSLGIQAQISLPVDSAKANPFCRIKDLVGTNDVAVLYDVLNDAQQHELHAQIRFNGEPVGGQVNQTNQVDVNLGDILYEPRRLQSVAGDVDGDGREELIYGFSADFDVARIKVAFIDPVSFEIIQSPHTSIGPFITLDGDDQNTYDNNEPSFVGKYELYAADLDGNGKDEIIAAHYNTLSNVLRVTAYYWNGSELASGADLITDININMNCGLNGFIYQESWGIVLDDFDFDRKPELVIASSKSGFPSSTIMRVYDITAATEQSFEFVQKAERNLGNNCRSINEVLTGDFNGDLIPEVALCEFSDGGLGVTFYRVGNNTTVAGTDYLEYIEPVAGAGFGTWNIDGYYSQQEYEDFYSFFGFGDVPELVMMADTKVGDYNNDGRDDLALCYPNDAQVIFGNANFNLMGYFNGAASINFSSELTLPTPYKPDFVHFTDLNLDGKPELINLFNAATSINSQQLSIQYHTPTGVQNFDNVLLDEEIVTSDFEELDNYYTGTLASITSGDFTGDGYSLGNPFVYQIDSIIQPIIQLGAPPVHSDNVGGEFLNITGCYASNCPFVTSYLVESDQTVTVSSEVRSDWAVGASVGGGGNIGVVNVNAKLEAKYGEGFSNAGSTSETETQMVEVTTSFDDYIYASIVKYNIREFPVYQGNELISYVISMQPIQIDHNWYASKSPEMELYRPKHEVGNILSYPNPSMQDQVLNDLDAPILGSNTYGIGNGQTYTWSVGYSELQEASNSTSRDISVNASLNISAFGAEVGITGEYSNQSLYTHKSTVSQQTTCTITHNSLTASVADAPYSMKPYMSWGNNGSLLVDYMIDPTEPQFGTDNYWSLNYDIQDPAWNLPWRLDAQRGFSVGSDSKTRLSKSFWMTDYSDGHQVIYPHPGDTVVVHARIFNYSLIPTTSGIPVSFFIGHPANGGMLLESIDGETEVLIENSIEPQWYIEVSMAIELPSAEIAPDARLYGVIDPSNNYEEVHEVNNYGWIGLGELFNLATEVLSTGDMNESAQDIFSVWPNPADDELSITTKFDGRASLTITDLSGRAVRRQMIAGNTTHQIDTIDLNSGMYIISVELDGNTWSRRVVVR